MNGYCVGCNVEKELIRITSFGEKTWGICSECYAIPEPRFFKTEKNISKLTRLILNGY